VPVGERVRVNVSILVEGSDATKRFATQWWAMDGFTVAIEYTDADGRQPMVSRAEIRQAATQGPWIERIAVFKQGKPKRAVIGRSSA